MKYFCLSTAKSSKNFKSDPALFRLNLTTRTCQVLPLLGSRQRAQVLRRQPFSSFLVPLKFNHPSWPYLSVWPNNHYDWPISVHYIVLAKPPVSRLSTEPQVSLSLKPFFKLSPATNYRMTSNLKCTRWMGRPRATYSNVKGHGQEVTCRSARLWFCTQPNLLATMYHSSTVVFQVRLKSMKVLFG